MQKSLHRLTQHQHFSDGRGYDRHAEAVLGGLYRSATDDVTAVAPRGAVVLDAGCGTGQLAARIAGRRPDVRVHGIDVEPSMIDAARDRARREGVADRVEFTVANLAELPLPDSSVDFVVSTVSMHHWTDPASIVTALQRVLRPGGQLWIYDFRWVSARRVRSAAPVGVRHAAVRTGWFPIALFQRLEIRPAHG